MTPEDRSFPAAGGPGRVDRLLGEVKSFGLRPTGFLRRPAQPSGFEVSRELSRGGQGVVYEAVQRSTGRRVALKIALARELVDADDHDRFLREVRLLASLKHPHLTTVYESGSVDGWRWLAMEFVEGEGIAHWAARAEVGPREVVERLVLVSDAVDFVHRHGVVHRDLKPSNIMIDRDGRPVVLDFGLAKSYRNSPNSQVDVTRPGAIVGSPLWLAPEQIHTPEAVGPLADVYALGRVLYHLLSGGHPYPASPTGPAAWLRAIQGREPTPLRRTAKATAGVDLGLEAIVMKAIDRDPNRRYPDAGALRDDLRAWLEGREISVRPDRPLGRAWRRVRRHPKVAWGVATALLLAVVIGAIWYTFSAGRWKEEVRQAVTSGSLLELWKAHLDPPAAVPLPKAVAKDLPSGPRLTHSALLARYLAEPLLGRVELPERERSLTMLTAPRGDTVVLRSSADPSLLWLGRDPDFEWQPLRFDGKGVHPFLAPDGRHLVTWDGSGRYRLWQLPASKEGELTELSWLGERSFTGMALIDAQITGETELFARDAGGWFYRLRVTDGRELARLPPLDGLSLEPAGFGAAMSPDGERIAVWDGTSGVFVISASDTGAPPLGWGETYANMVGTVRSVAFLDPVTIAIGAGRVRLFVVEPGGLTFSRELFQNQNLPSSPVWVKGGRLGVNCSPGEIELHPRGMRKKTWATPEQVSSFGVVREGEVLLTCEKDGAISRWDLSAGDGVIAPPWRRLLPDRLGGDASVFGIAFSPSGDRVAVATVSPPRLFVRGFPDLGEPITVSLPEGSGPNCLDWSMVDGEERLAIGSLSGQVFLWSLVPTEEPILHGNLEHEVHAVLFSADGRFLAAGGYSPKYKDRGRIRVWPADQPEIEERTLEDPSVGRITSLAGDRAGEWWVAGSSNSARLQWISPPLEGRLSPVLLRRADESVTRDLVTHPTGVFSAHLDDFSIRFTRPGEESPFALLEKLDGEPLSIDVHPQGALVAVGSKKGTLYLVSFDGDCFTPIEELDFPSVGGFSDCEIQRVRFSPDGRYLVVVGAPGTVPCYLDFAEATRYMAGHLPSVLDGPAADLSGASFAEAWAASVRESGR